MKRYTLERQRAPYSWHVLASHDDLDALLDYALEQDDLDTLRIIDMRRARIKRVSELTTGRQRAGFTPPTDEQRARNLAHNCPWL